MKTNTIIKVDLCGFQKKARSQEPSATAQLLSRYYADVEMALRPLGWRIIKTMGDAILIEAEVHLEFLSKFAKDLKCLHDVKVVHRSCAYETMEVNLGDYRCRDVVGEDIGQLFLGDEQTHTLV